MTAEKADDEQSEREESFAPAAGGSPQREGEDETSEACDQRAERSALAQSHGDQERARRLVAEGTNDEGGNEEQADGGEGADGRTRSRWQTAIRSLAIGFLESVILGRRWRRCAHRMMAECSNNTSP